MKFNWKLSLAVSSLFSLFICWPALFGGKTVFFGDNFQLIIPQKIFFIEQIKQGVFPFWNPYILSGTPFFADINQAIFYPSTILFLILPISLALSLTVFFHLIIIGLGQYFFSKTLKTSEFTAFFSMTLVLFSQPILMSINHVNVILLQVISWLPWIMGLFVLIARDESKKATICIPFFVSLAILGGHPQPLLYLIIPGLIYFFMSPKKLVMVRLLLPAIATSFLLTLFVTLPFIELFQHSTRAVMGIKETLNDSINPAHFIDFLIPNFFSDPSIGMRWGIYWIEYRRASVYITWIGLLAFMLSILKKKKPFEIRWLLTSSFIVLAFSLGKYLPFLSLLIERIQLFHFIRNFSLILILFPILISIVAGISIESMTRKIHRIGLSMALIFFTTTLLFYITIHSAFDLFWSRGLSQLPQIQHSNFHTYYRDKVIFNQISENTIYSAIFFLLSFFCLIMLPRKLWQIAIVMLIAADMYRASAPVLVFGNPEIYQYTNNPIIPYLDTTDYGLYRIVSSSGFFAYSGLPDYWANAVIQPPFANSSIDETEKLSNTQLINRRNVFASDWNIPYELKSPFGTSTFVLRKTAEYWDAPTSNSFNINEVDNPNIFDPRLSDQGVKYFIVDKTIFQNGIPQELSKFKVVQNTEKWAVYQIDTALPIVRFENDVGLIQLNRSSVNEINFSTNSSYGGYVLIKTANYPGWKCRVDSQLCTILADGFTMKTYAPAGTHIFQFKFIPNGWPYIMYISGISWFVYILFVRKVIRNEAK